MGTCCLIKRVIKVRLKSSTAPPKLKIERTATNYRFPKPCLVRIALKLKSNKEKNGKRKNSI